MQKELTKRGLNYTSKATIDTLRHLLQRNDLETGNKPAKADRQPSSSQATRANTPGSQPTKHTGSPYIQAKIATTAKTSTPIVIDSEDEDEDDVVRKPGRKAMQQPAESTHGYLLAPETFELEQDTDVPAATESALTLPESSSYRISSRITAQRCRSFAVL